MQGIFAGRTQLRYPYGRYGYTRGGGKIWHGGMDLVGLDSTDIRMPYYKNKRITGKVVRARRVTDHSNKTWEWGWYVCVQLDPGQTPDDVNYLYFCHCRELKVTAGQAVASGDLLAVMGQSGNAAGGYDHCHFEARATATGIPLCWAQPSVLAFMLSASIWLRTKRANILWMTPHLTTAKLPKAPKMRTKPKKMPTRNPPQKNRRQSLPRTRNSPHRLRSLLPRWKSPRRKMTALPFPSRAVTMCRT